MVFFPLIYWNWTLAIFSSQIFYSMIIFLKEILLFRYKLEFSSDKIHLYLRDSFKFLRTKNVIKIEEIQTTTLRQLIANIFLRRLEGVNVPCENFVKRTRNLFLRKFVKLYCILYEVVVVAAVRLSLIKSCRSIRFLLAEEKSDK